MEKQKTYTKAVLIRLDGVLLNDFRHPFIEELTVKYDLTYAEVKAAWNLHLDAFERGEISEDEFWKAFIEELDISGVERENIVHVKDLLRQQITEDAVLDKFFQNLKDEHPKLKLILLGNIGKGWADFIEDKFKLNYDSIIFSSNHGAKFPEPAFLEEVVNAAGVKPEECILIDVKDNVVSPIRFLTWESLAKLQSDIKEMIENFPFVEERRKLW